VRHRRERPTSLANLIELTSTTTIAASQVAAGARLDRNIVRQHAQEPGSRQCHLAQADTDLVRPALEHDPH